MAFAGNRGIEVELTSDEAGGRCADILPLSLMLKKGTPLDLKAVASLCLCSRGAAVQRGARFGPGGVAGPR